MYYGIDTSRYLDIVVFERDVRRERFHGDSSGSNGIHSNDTGTARRESLPTTSLDRRALNTHHDGDYHCVHLAQPARSRRGRGTTRYPRRYRSRAGKGGPVPVHHWHW